MQIKVLEAREIIFICREMEEGQNITRSDYDSLRIQDSHCFKTHPASDEFLMRISPLSWSIVGLRKSLVFV